MRQPAGLFFRFDSQKARRRSDRQRESILSRAGVGPRKRRDFANFAVDEKSGIGILQKNKLWFCWLAAMSRGESINGLAGIASRVARSYV
jgi:hypothetical protein